MKGLSLSSQKFLLTVARKSVETYLSTGDHEKFQTSEPELSAPHGCFVILTKDQKSRGSAGTFDDSNSLVDNTARMAIAAATRDSRFAPMTKGEWLQVRIKIHVLGQLEKVASLDDIQIGLHGVMVRYKDKKGIFLPEIAVEKKWSVPEFVTFCAREKAGLSPEECSKAEIYRYKVESISE